MTTVSQQLNADRVRTPEEVKRTLSEIAFVLHATRGIKLAMTAEVGAKVRPAAKTAAALRASPCAV